MAKCPKCGQVVHGVSPKTEVALDLEEALKMGGFERRSCSIDPCGCKFDEWLVEGGVLRVRFDGKWHEV